MDIIGAILLNGQYYFFETNYLYFLIDASNRIVKDTELFRDGLVVVTRQDGQRLIDLLQPFSIDKSDLMVDYESLETEDAIESEASFLPTVLIDFDSGMFYCSHPDLNYLNFREHITQDWAYLSVDHVKDLIPQEYAYWKDWKAL